MLVRAGLCGCVMGQKLIGKWFFDARYVEGRVSRSSGALRFFITGRPRFSVFFDGERKIGGFQQQAGVGGLAV